MGEADWLPVASASLDTYSGENAARPSPVDDKNDDDGEEPFPSSLKSDCVAVLVTYADNPRLARVLRSVASQTLRPSRVDVLVAGDGGAAGEGAGRGDVESVREAVGSHFAESGIAYTVEATGAATFSAAVQSALGTEGHGGAPASAGAADPEAPAGNEAAGAELADAELADAETTDTEATETWVWLLHGDVAPDPDCLEWLVRRASPSSKIGAVGPKQVSWENRAGLLEVGIRATRSGRRVPEIGKGDRDQGQLDGREDVLGVGSAGMLVRREALGAIGGLDPALGPFGDGLETSRRMWAGGWRVAVVPRAVVRHAQESMSRPARSTFAARRSAQLYNAVIAAPLLAVPFLWVAYIIAAPLRSLVRLAMKEPHMAWPELLGGLRFAAKTADMARGRRRLTKATKVSHSVLRTLEDSGQDVRQAQRAERKALRDAAEMATMPDPLVLAEQRQLRRRTHTWGLATFIVAVLVAAAGLLQQVGRGALAGGALLSDGAGIRELASMAASGWLPSGDGVNGPIDALWLVLSPFVALSQPFGGSLGAVATAIILLGVPLAAMAAYRAAGTFTASPQLRCAAGLLWAFAPSLLGAVHVGQVAGVVWHVLAPLALSLVVRCWRERSAALVGRASLVLAVMCAAAPLTLVVLLGVIVAAVLRRRWGWLWIPVPAVVLMAPSFIAAGSWRFLFSVPGAAVSSQPSQLGILTLSPTLEEGTVAGLSEPQLLTAAGFVLVLAVGVLCLFRNHRRAWIRWGWIAIAAGYLWALADSRISTAVSTSGGTLTPMSPWAGIALSGATLGLWIVLINAGDGMRAVLRQYSFGLRQLGAGLIVAAVAVGAIAPAGLWAVNNVRNGELATAEASIPAIAGTEQRSGARSRVLMLEPGAEGIEARVLRGDGTQLYETSMISGIQDVDALGADTSAADARGDLAAGIADISGGGSEAAQIFGDHAISMIVVPQDEGNSARPALVGELSSLGGLEYVTENAIGAFWRVSTGSDAGASAVSRLRITEPAQPAEMDLDSGDEVADEEADDEEADAEEADESTQTDEPTDIALESGIIGAQLQVKAGPEGRLLVLAERADSGWRATLDGEPLTPVTHGWRQAWELPNDGGELAIGHGPSIPWPGILQVTVIGIAVIVALPLKRKRYES